MTGRSRERDRLAISALRASAASGCNGTNRSREVFPAGIRSRGVPSGYRSRQSSGSLAISPRRAPDHRAVRRAVRWNTHGIFRMADMSFSSSASGIKRGTLAGIRGRSLRLNKGRSGMSGHPSAVAPRKNSAMAETRARRAEIDNGLPVRGRTSLHRVLINEDARSAVRAENRVSSGAARSRYCRKYRSETSTCS